MWDALNGGEAVRELKECHERKSRVLEEKSFHAAERSKWKRLHQKIIRLINEWVVDSPVKDCACMLSMSCQP